MNEDTMQNSVRAVGEGFESSKDLFTMKPNEPGSPMSPHTNGGDSDNFKTTTTRLGRILRPEDDEDGDQQGRHPTDDEDRDEQTASELLQAVEILTRLSNLDTEAYQQRLVNNTLPSTNHPSLAKLSQSIHRFQSVTITLTTEYDRQTTEIVDLQKDVNTMRDRVTKLEKAVTKLHHQNVKLKKKNKSEKSVARKLVEQLRHFRDRAAERKADEEFYRLADKVQRHEQALRERSDSNFSDLDSVTSSISGQSLVTDDGIATVKIHRERTLTWPQVEDEEDPADCAASEELPPDTLSPKPVDSNPFAMLLGQRPAQPYTLSMMPPCSLQFVALHVEQSHTTNLGIEPPSVGETAFCVCGYHGFDTSVNVKPTIGARLLAINSSPINASWKVQDLEEELESLENTRHLTFRNDKWDGKQKECLNLAVQEQKRLHPPERVEVAPFLRKRAQSSDSPHKQFMGFWNFNHHGSSKQKEGGTKDPTTPGKLGARADSNPLHTDFSSFWKGSAMTPSPKREATAIDEELLDADLSMPDVPDMASDENLIESQDGDAGNSTSAKDATNESIDRDSPLSDVFSSLWPGGKTPIGNESTAAGNEDPALTNQTSEAGNGDVHRSNASNGSDSQGNTDHGTGNGLSDFWTKLPSQKNRANSMSDHDEKKNDVDTQEVNMIDANGLDKVGVGTHKSSTNGGGFSAFWKKAPNKKKHIDQMQPKKEEAATPEGDDANPVTDVANAPERQEIGEEMGDKASSNGFSVFWKKAIDAKSQGHKLATDPAATRTTHEEGGGEPVPADDAEPGKKTDTNGFAAFWKI